MPFAVFRQYQRSLLAVFAILAMIGFILSDTLPRWMQSGAMAERNIVVAELYGKKIHLTDLGAMNEQRQRANRFMAYAGLDPNTFGGTTRPELIDALILEHEADRLGIPSSTDFARKWIDNKTFGSMNAAQFEFILSKFDNKNKVSGEQLLADIAGQVRLQYATQEIATPIVTPLDVFRNYRDQSERASFKVVPFLVDSFVGKVPEPTDAEVRAVYDQGKDVLPDPTRDTPGFKVPRQVKVEWLAINVFDVAKKIQARLTEDELKGLYEARKSEYLMDRELPADVFLGEPKLTPARYVPFSEVREALASSLSREKANEEIQETFSNIRDDTLDKFSDKYQDMVSDIAEARKEGRATEAYVLPRPEDLAPIAKKYNLVHETSPLLDRREAEQFGRISMARFGSGQSSDARKFADIAFDAKTAVYESFELNDIQGYRYLARKVEDSPAHVAPLDEVKNEVIRAWKIEKARPLALKAAEDLAAKLKTSGGEIKDLTVDGRPVIAISSTTKLKPGMPIPSQFRGQFRFERGPATLNDLPQITDAGVTLLDTLFSLKPGEVAVEPDLPKRSYYTMTLERREPVSYMALLGPNGSMASYWMETQKDVMTKSYTDGMARLREQAGYKPGDYPSESRGPDDDRSS